MFITIIISLHFKIINSNISMQFRAEMFVVRDLPSHLHMCSVLDNDDAARDENSKEFGINRQSCLTQLQDCDMCSGMLISDLTHDLYEGVHVLQHEMKLVLKHCIRQRHYFTLDMFNDSIRYMELGYMEVCNRPTPITKKVLKSSD